MTHFEITLLRGSQLAKFDVPAAKSSVLGFHVGDETFLPCAQKVSELLPHHYRKAFERDKLFWESTLCNDVMKLDLVSAKGEPMGSLTAKIILSKH